MNNPTCSVDDCEKAHYGKGLCNMHYQRLRKTGTTDARVKVTNHCKVEDCGLELTPPYGRGMCSLHYGRWQRHGDPLYVHQRVVGVDPCSIDGCQNVIQARGWCAAHWSRWDRYGDVNHRFPYEVQDGKRVCPHCQIDKPIGEFSHKSGGPCRPCVAATRAEWRRANPDAAYRDSIARAKRMEHAWEEDVARSVVLERDGWTCQLCFTPIDKTAKFPNGKSPSIDHVIPIARDGKHSYANTQATHLFCNISKGARMAA